MSKTPNIYSNPIKIISYLFYVCLIFFFFLISNNEVSAAKDPNIWGKSCFDNEDSGKSKIIMYHDDTDPNQGKGFQNLISNTPSLNNNNFPEMFYCLHMKKNEKYTNDLFNQEISPQKSKILTFYIPKSTNDFILAVGIESREDNQAPPFKDAGYKSKSNVAIFNLSNKEDSVIQISIGQKIKVFELTNYDSYTKNHDLINPGIKTVASFNSAQLFEKKDFTDKGYNTEYSNASKVTQHFINLNNPDQRINGATNPKNTAPTGTTATTTKSSGTTPTTVVTLTTSTDAKVEFTDKEINEKSNKRFNFKPPKIIKSININGDYEVILFKDGISVTSSDDLNLGKRFTTSGDTSTTDGIGIVYINKIVQESTTSTDSNANNSGNSSGNNSGNTTGGEPRIPSSASNLNYSLSAPPILPDVRNPGNLPFIHDPELSNIDEASGQYGTIKNETAYQAFAKVIEFAIKTLIKLVGVSSLFGITYGLVYISIAHGEEEPREKGVKMIMWSVIGLVLSLIAHAVVTGIMQFITGVGTINI